MPISREEFQAGRIDLTLPVRQILESRADLSFNAEEVRELLAQTLARSASIEDVVTALEILVTDGLVEAKEIEGDRWYTMIETRRRLGFR